jgi:hypothetical protein
VTLTSNSNITVATLSNLAPGSYLLIAKTTVVLTGTSGNKDTGTRCTVNGDPDTTTISDDYAETELGRQGGNGDNEIVGRATLQTQVTIDLASTTSITLKCRRNGGTGTAVARESKVIAIGLGSVTRTAVSG